MIIQTTMDWEPTTSSRRKANRQMNRKSNYWMEIRRRRYIASLSVIVAPLALILSSPTTIQPVFAHTETTLPINVDNQTGRSIVVVVGHSNEPAYGAKPGIHDGIHGLEVTLSDNATGLPIGDAQLKADKYYFTDLQSFDNARSVDDADETQEGFDVGAVFGETGRYLARQVVADGIYGYRLYGNISYFGVANVTINSTVFCTAYDADDEANTTKFNSPGWSGSFGCPQDIDTIAFPTNNTVLAGMS
jgi:hypothetical protein